MFNKEVWWLIPSGILLLFFLFNEGGFEVFKHPVLLGMFLFIAVTLVFGFLNFFNYSSSDEKFEKSQSSNRESNSSQDKNNIKITRELCAEILTSKGYKLYRGLNMIYSIAPIEGYDNDAVFRSKDLNEIYEFALKL
jgi:hypothetical protein